MALIKSIFLEILISVHRAAYLIIMKRGVQDERITHEFISCEFFFFFQRQDFALDYVFWVDMLQLEMPSFCDGIPKNYC